MGSKKRHTSHGQTIGIAWISIGLAIIACTAIFYSQRGGNSPETDTIAVAEQLFLQKKEDSVYRSRRSAPPRPRTYKTSRSKPYAPQCQPNTHHHRPAPPRPMRQPLVVDLNRADSTTLMLLHGIGPAYARRIVRYRDRLGGFVSLEQLLEVYGIDSSLLAHIAPYLTLDTTAISRLPINSTPLKQLLRHPYMEYYQARDIVTLRDRGVHFGSADDLRAVPSMADTSLRRLLPYLEFD